MNVTCNCSKDHSDVLPSRSCTPTFQRMRLFFDVGLCSFLLPAFTAPALVSTRTGLQPLLFFCHHGTSAMSVVVAVSARGSHRWLCSQPRQTERERKRMDGPRATENAKRLSDLKPHGAHRASRAIAGKPSGHGIMALIGYSLHASGPQFETGWFDDLSSGVAVSRCGSSTCSAFLHPSGKTLGKTLKFHGACMFHRCGVLAKPKPLTPVVAFRHVSAHVFPILDAVSLFFALPLLLIATCDHPTTFSVCSSCCSWTSSP